MKKLFAFLSLILFASLLPLFGAEIDPITDVVNWAIRIPELMSTLPGVILSVIFLPPIVIGVLNTEKKIFKYLLTGAIILGLTLLAYFPSFGFLHGEPFMIAVFAFALLLVGQVIGYAAIPNIFDAISDKFNLRKPKEPVE